MTKQHRKMLLLTIAECAQHARFMTSLVDRPESVLCVVTIAPDPVTLLAVVAEVGVVHDWHIAGRHLCYGIGWFFFPEPVDGPRAAQEKVLASCIPPHTQENHRCSAGN